MSTVNPASALSAPEPEGDSQTLALHDGVGTSEPALPQAAAPAARPTPRTLPVDNPGVDVIAVAELRRKAMLDALDPGPRPERAARLSRRGLLARIKSFYAQELIHDTPTTTGAADAASATAVRKSTRNSTSNG
ncbi:hypothetical protein [Streptomyces sp. NPDC101166]|uniref:hypothetical protein n=1 Tax=Streptomyces sp. NPDC101166 TaxID=3366120 RepID=UPI00381165EE